jgi:hypothetical protein
MMKKVLAIVLGLVLTTVVMGAGAERSGVVRTACATIESPTTADTDIPMMAAPRGVEVREIGCRVDTGTYTVRLETADATAIDSSDSCVTSTTVISWSGVSGTDGTVAEGEVIQFDVTASTDDAAVITICFKYTEED